jgi:hypothetical protein
VLRGGAFNNDTNNVRCANRNRNNPDNRNRNIGFRVVASTSFGQADCQQMASLPELPGGSREAAPRPRRRMAEPVPGRVLVEARPDK